MTLPIRMDLVVFIKLVDSIGSKPSCLANGVKRVTNHTTQRLPVKPASSVWFLKLCKKPTVVLIFIRYVSIDSEINSYLWIHTCILIPSKLMDSIMTGRH